MQLDIFDNTNFVLMARFFGFSLLGEEKEPVSEKPVLPEPEKSLIEKIDQAIEKTEQLILFNKELLEDLKRGRDV
jgi:hypothetical protein